jgi:hypothetical protein
LTIYFYFYLLLILLEELLVFDSLLSILRLKALFFV